MDEEAYERLKEYIASLQRHFANTEGHEEIMQDIEARIAEILSMKLSASKKIIVAADIDEVIAIIGKPEDMGGEAADEKAGAKENTNTSNRYGFPRRRLYRDEDNQVVGGVCAGLGAFFDIDPVWIRLVWAVSFFVFGFGFLFYILLLIIIPKAKTPAEKLEMRGDSYDLDSIKRSYKEESKRFKKRIKDIAYEFSDEATHEHWRRRGEDLMDSVSPAVKRAGNIIAKTALSIALFFILSLFIVLLVAFFSNTSTIHFGSDLPFDVSLWNFAAMFTDSVGETNLLMAGVALIVLTPLFMLIFGTVKALFGVRKRVKYVGHAASLLFWAGVIIGGIETYRIYQRFDEKEKVATTVDIAQPKGDTLYVESRLPAMGADMTEIEFGNGEYLAKYEPICFWPEARINIVPSENAKFYLKVEKMARGKNSMEATDNASAINSIYQVKDSTTLIVDRFATLPANTKFRGQRLTIVLAVPVGKYVSLGNSTRKALMNCVNVQDLRPRKMAGHVWKMEPQGLSCTNCADVKSMRHDDDDDDDDEF